MHLFENTNFKFIENRRTAYLISLIIIVIGLAFIFFTRKGLNLGIDFMGGYKARIRFEKSLSVKDIETIRKELKVDVKTIGAKKEIIVIEKMLPALAGEYAMHTLQQRETLGGRFESLDRAFEIIGMEKEYQRYFNFTFTTENITTKETTSSAIITTQETEEMGRIDINTANLKELEIGFSEIIPSGINELVLNKLSTLFEDRNNFKFESSTLIGSKVGSKFKSTAIWTLLAALVGMLIYISARFELKFAVGATIALIHDILVTVGILSVLNRSFTLPIIAALLTIVGYSINDTIVIFDRIREKLKYKTKESYTAVLNKAVNSTLARTVLTSVTTFVVVLAIFIFGGEAINDFALTLMIGIITGTYSSIFVATPVLVEWKKIFE